MNKKAPYYIVKTGSFAIKEAGGLENKEGTIVGYASFFGNEDLHGDVMAKGCFKKSIKKTKGKWPVFFNHNPNTQVGMNIKASEDENGLKITSKLYTDSEVLTTPKEVMELIKKAQEHGHPMGLSIGGMVKDWELIRDKKGNPVHVEIKEFDMLEHSITPMPANQKCSLTTKSLFSILEKENQPLGVDIQKKENLRSSEGNIYFGLLKNYCNLLKDGES